MGERDETRGGGASPAPPEHLGSPAIVCRWRLAGGRLPMENRHLRALRGREVDGVPVAPPLVAWVKEHIDWTLEAGALEHPDGVLMLVIGDRGGATMAVGPYVPLEQTTLVSLARRARAAQRESERTRVAPETLWLVRGDTLYWGDEHANVASAAASLIRDLARTMGMDLRRGTGPAWTADDGGGYDGVFLVSDEHGVVVPSDMASWEAERFRECYGRLLERAASRGRPR